MTDAPADVSQAQFASWMRRLLPDGWFPSPPSPEENEGAPVLNGMLQGIASVFAWVWVLLRDVYNQQRLSTASGSMLSIYAEDFFGSLLPRGASETDDSYRARISQAITPDVGTRGAVLAAFRRSVDPDGIVIEPWNASDCKGYGSRAYPASGGGYGYGASGICYGSLLTPFQIFVQSAETTNQITSASLDAVSAVKSGGTIIWVIHAKTTLVGQFDFGGDIQ